MIVGNQIREKMVTHRKRLMKEALRRHGRVAWQDTICAATGLGHDEMKALFGNNPETISVDAFQKIANFLGFEVYSRLVNVNKAENKCQ